MLGTIKVGHGDDSAALTGCTVFLPPEGTVGACEVRGGGPATRETASARPRCRPVFATTGIPYGYSPGNLSGRRPLRSGRTRALGVPG